MLFNYFEMYTLMYAKRRVNFTNVIDHRFWDLISTSCTATSRMTLQLKLYNIPREFYNIT